MPTNSENSCDFPGKSAITNSFILSFASGVVSKKAEKPVKLSESLEYLCEKVTSFKSVCKNVSWNVLRCWEDIPFDFRYLLTSMKFTFGVWVYIFRFLFLEV